MYQATIRARIVKPARLEPSIAMDLMALGVWIARLDRLATQRQRLQSRVHRLPSMDMIVS
jgi:hypothetical protein